MRDTGEFLFTSESVSEGHPDKVADRLSDTVLDAYLAADPYSRVACETLVTTNRVVFAGETRGPASVTPGPADPSCPHGDPRHRLRPGRVQLGQGGDRLPPACAVIRHRPGRGRRRQQGRGRRRPGHDVRLCLPRDRRADAGADPLCPRHPAPHPRAAARPRQVGRGPAARRQEPGHAALHRRQAGRRRPASWSPPSMSRTSSRPRSSECSGRS